MPIDKSSTSRSVGVRAAKGLIAGGIGAFTCLLILGWILSANGYEPDSSKTPPPVGASPTTSPNAAAVARTRLIWKATWDRQNAQMQKNLCTGVDVWGLDWSVANIKASIDPEVATQIEWSIVPGLLNNSCKTIK